MKYVGQELDVFMQATAWKKYYSRSLLPYLRGDVLEVGGGIGGTTPYLIAPATRTHTVLEPDPTLLRQLETNLRELMADDRVRPMNATLDALPAAPSYDAILYIDVLEHIKDDRAELVHAAQRLRPGGVLAVLSPAFEVLRSPFDDAVGHWRRYTMKSLKTVFPGDLAFVCSRYFDAVGAGLSLSNRLVSRSAQPTAGQIQFWNKCIIPISRIVDPLFRKLWGRSVLVIGKRPGAV